MATTRKTKTTKAGERAANRAARASATPVLDAIALLESDHRAVDDLFDQFGSAGSDADKADIARQICLALRVHAQIEEELLYPPAREKTGDTDLVDEAVVEHMGAKTLIAQIEAMAPGQPLFDARVKVSRRAGSPPCGGRGNRAFPRGARHQARPRRARSEARRTQGRTPRAACSRESRLSDFKPTQPL